MSYTIGADGAIRTDTLAEALEIQRAKRRQRYAGADERHVEPAGGGFRYRVNQGGRSWFGPTRATQGEAETDYQAALAGNPPGRLRAHSDEWRRAVGLGVQRAWARRRAEAGDDGAIHVPLRACRICARPGHDRRTCPGR